MEIKRIKTSTYIWELIKYKPLLYIATILLWIIKDIIPLVYGIFVKEFFDILSGKPSFNISIMELLMLIMLTTLVQILVLNIGFKSTAVHKFSISSLLRRNMLNRILKKPGAEAVKVPVGEAINYFNDDVETIEANVEWLSWLTGQIARAVFAVVILMTINIKITITVFVPLTAIILIAQKSEKKVEKNRELSRKATTKVTGAIGEIFESVLAIKVSGSQRSIINNLKKLNEKRHNLMLKDSLLTQLIDSVYNNAVNIGTGLILLLAAFEIKSGNFGVGDFAIFVYYLSFVTDSIESTGNFLVNFKQAGVSFRRIEDFLQTENNKEIVKHKPIALKTKDTVKFEECNDSDVKSDCKDLKCLDVKGLSYIYDKSQKGIKNIDFKLNKGETIVICGRTGSGKTTLLKTLIGLLSPALGEIYWNGEKVENTKDFFVPPISAYTSQVPNLFSETIKNNILFGVPENTDNLNQAIKSAVLEEDIKELSDGIDTVIGSKGVKLSGGQIQRVAAARMFIRQPQLLVFDDISSALDVETEKTLWTRLFRSNKNTCIIVSNRRNALEQADKVILMKDGEIEAQGSLKELLETSNEMQSICG